MILRRLIPVSLICFVAIAVFAVAPAPKETTHAAILPSSFAGWNLSGWEALEAVLFAGKTTCRIEKQGGLSLRRTVIFFEQDRRSFGMGK